MAKAGIAAAGDPRRQRNAERRAADRAIAEQKQPERAAKAEAEEKLKADQKAARDVKYAARKARQK